MHNTIDNWSKIEKFVRTTLFTFQFYSIAQCKQGPCSSKGFPERLYCIVMFVLQKSIMVKILVKEKYFSTLRGTRQHCRDNVTLFSGQTIVAYCFLAIFVGGTPVGQRGIIIYRIFFVAEAVTCCCALVVARPKNWHVASTV